MELALQRIEDCRKSKSTHLDLSDCGLTILPNKVVELDWVEFITLSSVSYSTKLHNNFSSDDSMYVLGYALTMLPSLNTLFLDGCNIANITSLGDLINLKNLNLSVNSITNIDSLSKLVNLEYLDLGGNQISEIKSLSSLSKLTKLAMSGNKISDISALSKLVHLEELLLNNNQIFDISSISHLKSLELLALAENKIDNINPLKKLKKLNGLGLVNNRIINIKPLSQLINLDSLGLSSNDIIDISPLVSLNKLQMLGISNNKIQDIQPITYLKNLERINLKNNPINTIPLEMLDFEAIEGFKTKEDNSSDLTAIYNFKELISIYYASIKRNNKSLQTDIKLILVGNSTAGKTSLSRILRGLPFKHDEPTTHGIKIEKWTINGKDLPFLDANLKKYQADIRIWDFGGQEYYHGTHHLFLDINAIYALLWEEQTNDNSQQDTIIYSPTKQKESLAHFHYRYWLDNIRYYAPVADDKIQSPVLMVQNKVEGNKQTLIDPLLCDTYKVQNTFPLSAKLAKTNKENDKKYKYWFELLKEDLLQVIFDKVHQNAVYVPTTWAKISQWITDLAFEENLNAENPFIPYIKLNSAYILLDDFRLVCKELDDEVTDYEINLL
jgi:Leucine-rich repeat (LRR) protein